MSEIIDSKAKIGGSKERHVQSGSQLSLSCRIDEYTGPPTYVFWYRNSEVINYSERKSILIRSGNLQHTIKYDKHLKRRLKPLAGENENSSLMPTSTILLSNTQNPSTTNISHISEQVLFHVRYLILSNSRIELLEIVILVLSKYYTGTM